MRSLLPLLLLVPWSGCPGPGKPTTDGPQAARGTAEQRPDNDRELVGDFAALRECTYVPGDGRLDHACPRLVTLRLHLQSKRRTPEGQRRVLATLIALLESKREVTRLVAAESLAADHREAAEALQRALGAERAPVVKATLLRQLCWSLTPAAERQAVAFLDRSEHERVRVEAAACLARGGKRSPAAVAALRAALRSDPSPSVRGNACTALGAQRARAAVPEVAALLSVDAVAWRCSTALGAIGDEPAYVALRNGITAAVGRGRLPAQHVAALGSFADKAFFERDAVLALLARIAGERRLSWLARARAVSELGRLGGKAKLRELRERTADDDNLRAAVDRALR